MTYILGIESSCDETAASVVENGCRVLSNIVASQDDLHLEYGGVVPEIASRAHLERILPVIEQAIEKAGISLHELDAIAVGNRPGLIGSLLVGVAAAKSLAWSIQKPLITVDHVIAHLWAPSLDGIQIEYPALGLVVSGGHTSIVLLKDHSDAQCISKTVDDAAGEAFDKAAAILGLGWPGGPQIEQAAKRGEPLYDLPRPQKKNGQSFHFSFSGLKTALLYGVCGQPKRIDGKVTFSKCGGDLSEQERCNWAASFQIAAVETLEKGLRHALEQQNNVRCIVAGGGVLSNTVLRNRLHAIASSHHISLHLPEQSYCMDNAAMIAGLGYPLLRDGQCDSLAVTASPQGVAS